MERCANVGLVVALCVASFVGCGQGSSTDTATNAPPQAAGIVVKNAADPATNPIAKAAAEFFDAVLKGDKQRANAMLTPRAIEQIGKSDMHFEPAGIDRATFQVGEVRTPSESQAIVQFVLLQNVAEGKTHAEEMCCLMRLVDNQWRVSGIAAGNGPQHPPTILDFENPPRELAPTPPMAGAVPGQNPASPASGRPSPPRTAQEPTAPPRY